VANPHANDVSRQYIAAQMAALCKELQFLFGAGTLGVTRVASWVTNNSTLGDDFTRQRAYKEIRLLFPFRKETHHRIYNFFGLEELDQALDDGLTKWECEEERLDQDDFEEERGPSTSQAARNSLRALYGASPSSTRAFSMSNSADII
jgi:hypothetical protein